MIAFWIAFIITMALIGSNWLFYRSGYEEGHKKGFSSGKDYGIAIGEWRGLINGESGESSTKTRQSSE